MDDDEHFLQHVVQILRSDAEALELSPDEVRVRAIHVLDGLRRQRSRVRGCFQKSEDVHRQTCPQGEWSAGIAAFIKKAALWWRRPKASPAAPGTRPAGTKTWRRRPGS